MKLAIPLLTSLGMGDLLRIMSHQNFKAVHVNGRVGRRGTS
jgi:hypothetical protein